MTGPFEIDTDPARVDRDVVGGFLSTQAYRARWRTRTDVETQLDPGWWVSDGVAFGYLADVFVLSPARGHGGGRALVDAMLEGHPRIRRVLFTDDAHDLYEPLGFAPPDRTCLVRPGSAGRG